MTNVYTQKELDEALARNDSEIWIRGNSNFTVQASGSSTVRAYDSSTVQASGSSTVRAYDSSTVQASKYVPVHHMSGSSTIDATIVIKVPALAVTSDWADFHGVENTGKTMVVFKAVDDSLKSGRGFSYPIGETVKCDDWEANGECGSGLHFSPHPHMATRYFTEATRWLACRVSMSKDVQLLDDKVKARSAKVLYEVNEFGDRLPV